MTALITLSTCDVFRGSQARGKQQGRTLVGIAHATPQQHEYYRRGRIEASC